MELQLINDEQSQLSHLARVAIRTNSFAGQLSFGHLYPREHRSSEERMSCVDTCNAVKKQVRIWR